MAALKEQVLRYPPQMWLTNAVTHAAHTRVSVCIFAHSASQVLSLEEICRRHQSDLDAAHDEVAALRIVRETEVISLPSPKTHTNVCLCMSVYVCVFEHMHDTHTAPHCHIFSCDRWRRN